VRALDAIAPDAARARGEARDAILRRIAAINDELADAAVSALSDADRRALEQEADAELAPFRARMSDDAFRQSRGQALQRLARDRFGLPSF